MILELFKYEAMTQKKNASQQSRLLPLIEKDLDKLIDKLRIKVLPNDVIFPYVSIADITFRTSGSEGEVRLCSVACAWLLRSAGILIPACLSSFIVIAY